MRSPKLRVGIIGIRPEESWAAKAHLPALRALPEFEIVAVATTRQASAEVAALHYGIPLAFGDPQALLRHPEIDIVAVCVKVPSHHALVMAALEAGKHVYCEWPLGCTTAQASEMRDVAARMGVCHIVGLQARGAPAVSYARDLVAAGYVGEVLSCTMISSVPGWGLATEAPNAYTLDRRNGANILTIAAGHSLDLLSQCVGEFRDLAATVACRRTRIRLVPSGETVEVTAPDQVAIAGTLRSGAVASVHIQGGTPHATKLRLEINGTEGSLALHDAGPLSAQYAPIALHGAQGRGAKLAEVPIPDCYRWVPSAVPAGPPFNVAQLYARLANAIRDGMSPSPDFGDAVQRHLVIDAVERASDTGQRQTL